MTAQSPPARNAERGTRNLLWSLRGGLFLLLLATGWAAGSLLRGRHVQAWPPRSGKLRLLTTIFPLYDFARQVGGPDVEVRNLLPPGVDPHEFALSPRDVTLVAGADVLVANGSGLDDFLTEAVHKAEITQKPIVDCSEGMQKSRRETGDPHRWLDPQLATHYIEFIADALEGEATRRGQPDKAAAIKDRAARYKDQLAALDREYQAGLTGVWNRSFIAFHGAYRYLAERYGLEVAAVWQPSPGREPSPREVEAILKVARDKRVGALFSEPQFSPRAIEMIAADAHLPVYTLDPLETAEDFTRSSYLSTMRQNLATLVRALGR